MKASSQGVSHNQNHLCAQKMHLYAICNNGNQSKQIYEHRIETKDGIMCYSIKNNKHLNKREPVIYRLYYSSIFCEQNKRRDESPNIICKSLGRPWRLKYGNIDVNSSMTLTKVDSEGSSREKAADLDTLLSLHFSLSTLLKPTYRTQCHPIANDS